MKRKYNFTGEQKVISYCGYQPYSAGGLQQFTVHRIRAARSFGCVKKGDLGGWIYSEDNLSHDGNAWVGGEACVSDNALVCDDAQVLGNSVVKTHSKVCGNALVTDDAVVAAYSKVCDNAAVYDSAEIERKSEVGGNAQVRGDSLLSFNVAVTGHAVIDNSCLAGRAYIHGNAKIKDFDHSYCCLNVGGDTVIDSTDAFVSMTNLRLHCEQMEICEAVRSIVYYWLWYGIVPYGFEEIGLPASPAEASKVLEKFLLSNTERLKDAVLAYMMADQGIECFNERIEEGVYILPPKDGFDRVLASQH